jgi:hypothetical protein
VNEVISGRELQPEQLEKLVHYAQRRVEIAKLNIYTMMEECFKGELEGHSEIQVDLTRRLNKVKRQEWETTSVSGS